MSPRIVPPEEARFLIASTMRGVAWNQFTLDLLNTAAVLGEQREAVLALHQNAGRSQGYKENGSYGYIDACCGTCGEFGEYGVPYPCPTARALGVES